MSRQSTERPSDGHNFDSTEPPPQYQKDPGSDSDCFLSSSDPTSTCNSHDITPPFNPKRVDQELLGRIAEDPIGELPEAHTILSSSPTIASPSREEKERALADVVSVVEKHCNHSGKNLPPILLQSKAREALEILETHALSCERTSPLEGNNEICVSIEEQSGCSTPSEINEEPSLTDFTLTVLGKRLAYTGRDIHMVILSSDDHERGEFHEFMNELEKLFSTGKMKSLLGWSRKHSTFKRQALISLWHEQSFNAYNYPEILLKIRKYLSTKEPKQNKYYESYSVFKVDFGGILDAVLDPLSLH